MHDPEDAACDAELEELALPLARDLHPQVAPPEAVRRSLLDHAAADSFHDVLADEGEWRPHPVPGVRVKLLSRDEARGYAMFLLEAASRAEFPSHDHSGAEECFVLRGELTIGGRTLRAGDFHHAPAGTRHDPIITETGCLVLLVADARDYID
jgi:anti-sigma factor ChrR (cupin superfamily)